METLLQTNIGWTAVSPWPLLWRYVLLLRATVQMCIKEIWWITCCCTVGWSLYLHYPLLHTLTHTHSPRPWDLGPHGLSLISSSLLVHQLGWTTRTGCACVTQVAVVQRFIPLQCCWVEDVLRAIQWNATVKALLRNSTPSFCFKLEECFNFLF